MDATVVTDVCRLCPSAGGGEDLLYVFDERLSVKNNMQEVILVTTGIEIQETDLISKKICHRCCTKTLQMFLFRQDAQTQDRALKERCNRLLEDKGIKLPNTCITIKRERHDSFSPIKRPKVELDEVLFTSPRRKPKTSLHPSVADIYKNYPRIKIPKKCLERHLAPVVSFTMGDIEKYFKKRNLDMKKFIYKPGIKKAPLKAVAKKSTSVPSIQKIVSPIKISKKMLEKHEVEQAVTNIDYICSPVHKDKLKKTLFSSPNSSKLSSMKRSEYNNIAIECESPTKINNASKLATIQPAETKTSVIKPVVPVSQAVQTSRPNTPKLMDSISGNSTESSLTSTSKPEFIESLGLTPTVTATKSQTLHVCNLCGSVHNNGFKLKTHMRKHMVCQFCKLRFKTLEAKEDHVENSCQVKEILNSVESVVELEKVHLNLEIRKKYKDVFASFDSIPGLIELYSTEQITVKASSPRPYLNSEDATILSDSEKHSSKSSNSLNVSQPPSSTPLSVPLRAEETENPSVSVVNPDVRIKNNIVMNNIPNNLTDKQIVRDLVERFKPLRKRTIDKINQTDLPATKDIKINATEGYCEFKHLKEQLRTYMIPISITDGPTFHVAYQYKDNSNYNKTLALWNDLPVIDVSNKNTQSQNFPNDNLTIPQSAEITSSVLPIKSTNILGPSAVQNNSLAVTAPISNVMYYPMINAKTSNSSTSLLHNFAQTSNFPPVVNQPIPVPQTYVPTPGYNGNSRRTNSKSASLSRNSLPAYLSKDKIASLSVNRSRSSVNSMASPAISNATANCATSLTDSNCETSKFRVKNVWELQ